MIDGNGVFDLQLIGGQQTGFWDMVQQTYILGVEVHGGQQV